MLDRKLLDIFFNSGCFTVVGSRAILTFPPTDQTLCQESISDITIYVGSHL